MKRQMILGIVYVLVATASASIAQQQPATLELATAQPMMAAKLSATGRVIAINSARMCPRVSGQLVELGKTADGQPLDAGATVDAGQMLFRLNDTTFANTKALAEAALKSAQATLDNLVAKVRQEKLEQLKQALAELDARIVDRQRDEVRYKRLVEVDKTVPVRRLEEVTTELQVLQSQRKAAEARLNEAVNGPTPSEIAMAAARVNEAQMQLNMAQTDLTDATVKAPYAGMITRRFKGVGDYIVTMPPTEVLELVALDKLEAELRLPEAYFASIEAGKTRVLLHSALLKEDLELPIARVIQDIDPAQGTFPVRVRIPADRRGGLAPGAFLTAEILVDGTSQAVVLPQRAVQESAGKAYVFVAQGGKMVRRDVEIGDRMTESVVIKTGVLAGEKALTGPAAAMSDGAALPPNLLK